MNRTDFRAVAIGVAAGALTLTLGALIDADRQLRNTFIDLARARDQHLSPIRTYSPSAPQSAPTIPVVAPNGFIYPVFEGPDHAEYGVSTDPTTNEKEY